MGKALWFLSLAAWLSAPCLADNGIDVYESHGDLIMVDKSGTKRLITPKSIHSHGRYLVRIKKDASKGDQDISVNDKVEARKIMFQANEAFFRGEIEKAWKLTEQAEKLDPKDYRAKTMKGSLLYKIGSKDLAVVVWKESLATNPDQPEIQDLLTQIEKGQAK